MQNLRRGTEEEAAREDACVMRALGCRDLGAVQDAEHPRRQAGLGREAGDEHRRGWNLRGRSMAVR